MKKNQQRRTEHRTERHVILNQSQEETAQTNQEIKNPELIQKKTASVTAGVHLRRAPPPEHVTSGS